MEAAYIGLWPCICNGAVLGLFPRLRDYTRNTVGSCLDVTAYICRSSQWEGLRFISLLGSVVKLYAFASCSYVAAIQEVQTSHSLTRRGLRAAPLRSIERAQAVVFQGSARREGVAACRELSLSQCAVLSSHHCLFIHVEGMVVAKRNAADTRTFGSANMRHTSVLLERNLKSRLSTM